MTLCDYLILEHTTSELLTHGVPFIVVLRLRTLDSYTLTSYVLRDWRKKIEVNPEHEADDIEVFIEDLRHYSGRPASGGSFFERLEDLSVGPIRAFVSGSCSIQDLDEVVRVFFDERPGALSWKKYFYNLNEGI